MRSSSRLNSSKQPHAPTWQRPTKIRPIDLKSKASSQAEDEHEAAELRAERLHGLRLARAGRAAGPAAERRVQRLRRDKRLRVRGDGAGQVQARAENAFEVHPTALYVHQRSRDRRFLS
jgi:hypothetical protein